MRHRLVELDMKKNGCKENSNNEKDGEDGFKLAGDSALKL